MQINLRWPGGKTKCLTLSYDDGVVQDRRFVDLLNRHGLRGTFHLNAGTLGKVGKVHANEVAPLYAGHEVSAHGLTHPWLERLDEEAILHELREDRRQLEALVGYPVRGMSYPYGSYDGRVLALLSSAGIEYARTVAMHGGFSLPTDFGTWHPTCHHRTRLMELTDRLLAHEVTGAEPDLLYVWGHTYEFDEDGGSGWSLMEDFCSRVASQPDIWYATNIEIADYVRAARRLAFSVDRTTVTNPSAMTIQLQAGPQTIAVPPAQTTRLPASPTS